MNAPTRGPRLSARQIRRGLIAGALAWVFPGAGHWSVGARGRAGAFAGLVLFAAAVGVALDGNLAVIDARAPVVSRLQVAADLALGPGEPLLRAALYGRPIYRGDESAVGDSSGARQALAERRSRTFRRWSAYGSAFLLAAGLMNALLIVDAWDLAVGRKE